MSVYEIALLGVALFGTFSAISFLSMFADAGSWRVFFGFAILTGIAVGIAHVTGANGFSLADIVPAISAAVALVFGPPQ